MLRLPRRWPQTILAGPLALAGAAAAPAVAAANSSRDGYVYVNDNSAGTNTVAGFARQPDGRLISSRAPQFRAGGAGTGSGLASQGAIQVTSDGHYVLAVDAGSNQISVLRIERGGALELVRDGVVASGGAQPVSVTEHDGLVYVANAGRRGTTPDSG